MVNKKNILPSPMDPKTQSVTVAVLTGKLDALFQNVKELVTSTARGTENALRKEIECLDTKLVEHDTRFDKIEAKVDKIGQRLDDHETCLTNLETAHP